MAVLRGPLVAVAHGVYLTLAIVLVLFGAYWVVQTVELWNLGDEEHPEARKVSGVRP